MIKEDSLGLVVAENDEEKFWIEIKESTEKDIKNLEKMLKFNKGIIAMCEEKIKNATS